MKDRLEQKFKEILCVLAQEKRLVSKDENFKETPWRMAKMFREFLWTEEERKKELDKCIAVFPSHYDEIIVERNVKVWTLCPHHGAPVKLDVAIGYLPRKKMLGLSKLSRIVKSFAKQAILQEELTYQIGDFIYKKLKAKGVGVIVKGEHFCMKARGVEQDEVDVVTTKLFGCFLKNEIKSEFYRMVRL